MPVASLSVADKCVIAQAPLGNLGVYLKDFEQSIIRQDKVSVLIHKMMETIHEGFNTFHKQVVEMNTNIGPDDINSKVIALDSAARQIDIHFQQLASQVAQGLGHHQSVDRHKTWILEYKVIQNLTVDGR